MQTTPVYHLNKPEYSDIVDVADLNENMDQIEAALGTTAKKSEIINRLDQNITNQPLSAAMGKQLNDNKVNKSATMIPSGTDFNTIKTTGFYATSAAPSTAGLINYPINQTGVLAVYGVPDSGVHTQEYRANTGEIFTRSNYSSRDWTAWAQLITDKDYKTFQVTVSANSTKTITVPSTGWHSFTAVTTGSLSNLCASFYCCSGWSTGAQRKVILKQHALSSPATDITATETGYVLHNTSSVDCIFILDVKYGTITV